MGINENKADRPPCYFIITIFLLTGIGKLLFQSLQLRFDQFDEQKRGIEPFIGDESAVISVKLAGDLERVDFTTFSGVIAVCELS